VRVSFIIPAYDEARTIGEVLERIDALELDHQVIVVDDGSTDGTAEIAATRPRSVPGSRTSTAT
jgi:glycosyltransferase involved in cell wall biosynthesis